MTKKRKKIQWLIAVITCILVPTLFVAHYLAGHLNKEKDPGGMLQAATRLVVTRVEITTIRSNSQQLLVKYKSLGSFRSNDALESYLAQYGWTPTDRMGSTYYFQRRKETLKVSLRPFTRFYRVCDLDKPPS